MRKYKKNTNLFGVHGPLLRKYVLHPFEYLCIVIYFSMLKRKCYHFIFNKYKISIFRAYVYTY